MLTMNGRLSGRKKPRSPPRAGGRLTFFQIHLLLRKRRLLKQILVSFYQLYLFDFFFSNQSLSLTLFATFQQLKLIRSEDMTKIACIMLLKIFLDYRKNKVKIIRKESRKYRRFMRGANRAG